MSRAPFCEAGEAAPVAFDAVAYVRDLEGIGVRVLLVPGERPERICLLPADGKGFGRPFLEVSRRWSDAVEACDDHVGAVVAYLLGRGNEDLTRTTRD